MWFRVALVKFQPRSQGLSSDFGLVEVFFTNLNAEIVACILLFRKSSHKPNLESSIKYGDLGVKKMFFFFGARAEKGIARHTDASSVVWTLIDIGKLANQMRD